MWPFKKKNRPILIVAVPFINIGDANMLKAEIKTHQDIINNALKMIGREKDFDVLIISDTAKITVIDQ